MLRKWMTPELMALAQVLSGFIWLLVLTLLVALCFRQRSAEAFKTNTL
jgi:hypothetical protein